MIYVDAGGNDSFTKLLLHLDQSGGLADVSASAHTVTANGSAAISASQSKFGGASASLAGAGGNYLSSADSADWTFGTGDFTIDAWYRFSSLASGGSDASVDNVLCFQQDGSGFGYILATSQAGNLRFVASNSPGTTVADYTVSHGMSINTWYHLAFARSGTSFFIFKDGVSLGLTANTAIASNSLSDVAASFLIGASNVTLVSPGFVDEFRLSKGIARWTSNFSPYGASYD